MQIGPYRENIPCKQPTKDPPNVAQGPEMIRIDLQNVKVTTVTVHTGESYLPMAVLFYVVKYNNDILVGLFCSWLWATLFWSNFGPFYDI